MRLDTGDLTAQQRNVCGEHGSPFVASRDLVNSGFAITTVGSRPINGLRHLATEDTTGWYIWCGEKFSYDKGFFKPVHTIHLREQLPEIAPLLGLSPGHRFLQNGDYLDIWFDAALLKVF